MSVSTNSNAWIVIDHCLVADPRLAPYTLILKGGRSLYGAIAERDWVPLLTPAGGIIRVGRVFRVRSDLETTTLYLDKLHAAQKAVTFTDLGLTLPTGLVTRLSPDDLAASLSRDGVSSLDEVSLINDAAYVRELLELATRDDLLELANGPSELIVDMSVRDRYLVGKLAPRKPGGAITDGEVEPAAAVDEEDNSEHEEKASLHEPGAEFNRASGRVVPEDDALDKIELRSGGHNALVCAGGRALHVDGEVGALR